MAFRPGTEIRYTPFPNKKYPDGSTPQEITKHSMDSTYQLEQLLTAFQK
jgi:A1 cistron-splicing factor AAR2